MRMAADRVDLGLSTACLILIVTKINVQFSPFSATMSSLPDVRLVQSDA